ncbi:unnamed protein product [Gemmataceae bacterium]|nr:unnamed protein product [Gemmataceae bacterium]VTT96543.1 unnamed protein product [Gemmataceae bacterium]
MESWRQVWREGFAPVLTAAQLELLAEVELTLAGRAAAR